jgi:hypothetical protein
MDAGLITAAAGADVTVTNTGNDGTLNVTLAQLSAIGADHVQSGAATLDVDAGVGFTDQASLEAALNQLLTPFENQAGTVNKTIFTPGETVDLHVAGSLGTGQTIHTELFNQLKLLGIDDVLDEHGHSIKPPGG